MKKSNKNPTLSIFIGLGLAFVVWIMLEGFFSVERGTSLILSGIVMFAYPAWWHCMNQPPLIKNWHGFDWKDSFEFLVHRLFVLIMYAVMPFLYIKNSLKTKPRYETKSNFF
jgi:hypothetical protein